MSTINKDISLDDIKRKYENTILPQINNAKNYLLVFIEVLIKEDIITFPDDSIKVSKGEDDGNDLMLNTFNKRTALDMDGERSVKIDDLSIEGLQTLVELLIQYYSKKV